MEIINNDLLMQVKNFVINLYEEHKNFALRYHNLDHTREVVKRCNEIAAGYSLTEDELFILNAAAWFHDCGYLTGQSKDHEDRGISIMTPFMKEHYVDEDIFMGITECIQSTKFPAEAISILSKILCDADAYHFGTDHLFVSDELVKTEFKLLNGFVPADWDLKTLQLLNRHYYHTHYCKKLLEAGKQRNIGIIMQKLLRG